MQEANLAIVLSNVLKMKEGLNEIDEGLFGECYYCKGIIGFHRLMALPESKFFIMVKIKKRNVYTYLLIALGVMVFSYWRMVQVPSSENIGILDEMYLEPFQKRVNIPIFEVVKNKNIYYVEPFYEYSIYGLVVSGTTKNPLLKKILPYSESLNVMDLCVIWGDNVRSKSYEKMKFYNSSYSCHPLTSDPNWQTYYNPYKTSNNHLITKDKKLSKKLLSLKPGDQILIQGYLSSYYYENKQLIRKSSFIREDFGCETIYVTDVQVLKPSHRMWVLIHKLSKFFIFVLLLYLFKEFAFL